MIDNEIIKVLDTPYNRKWVIAEDGKGDFIRVGDLVDLIKRLKAENERLEKKLKEQKAIATNFGIAYIQAKSEARKEFAERLKEIGQKRLWICGITEADIDNLLKEMEKKNNG